MKEVKPPKVSINDLFNKLNNSINPETDKADRIKLQQRMDEAQMAVSKILADDSLSKMLIQFADATNKTLKLSMAKLEKDEDNIVLLVKMMAYILATLENRKFININY